MRGVNRHRLYRLPILLLPAILLLSATNHGQISAPTPGGTLASKKVVLPTTDELIKNGPKVAVETAAEVLGMVRGPQRNTTSVNKIEVVASGTMAERAADGTWREYKVKRLTEAVDFVIPAARVDVERSGSSGSTQRQIEVVAGNRAWDEEKPGINGTPVTGGVDDRVRMIWLTPQGAMWGALRAAEKNEVRVANEMGRLAITYMLNGEPVKVLLDSKLLPEKVQILARSSRYGDTALEATYSGYKDFAATPVVPEGFLAPCPSRIIYKAGGRIIRDVTASDCEINPYVIFPLPANISKASAGK